MTKRKKSGPRSSTRTTGHKIIIVDLLEIGSSHGNLTLRGGRDTGQVTCIALPAEVLPSFLTTLEQARLDAEEEYWNVVRHVMATAAPGSSPADASQRVERWLLSQNWSKVLSAVPDDAAHSLSLLTHAGHISFRLAPPYTKSRVLAVFDPVQLHRLQGTLAHHYAMAQQQAASSPLHPRNAIALALDHLAGQPWPPPPAQPPSEEAGQYMRGRYEAFQRRSPYLRTEANTPDLEPDSP
ncbi:hypothetical protein OG548_45735 [Streptomyces sp. NBC_01356]|uniref:hypothetical protein n=1 Tax=Streptomyces sp. NBC_01356 TaxID=2903836 RepID=UPI002E2FFF17|nr:hypothetical protein [Streptomyces sp. NBC_01356]